MLIEVCGSLGEAGTVMKVSAPVGGEEAETLFEVLRVVRCPHYGYLSELKIEPITGRHHQIREHCAEFLGAPIVNDERPLFDAAAAAWERRTGTSLPPYHVRGGGNLFLQAVAMAFPPPGGEDSDELLRVQVPVSSRFERLLRTSARAYQEYIFAPVFILFSSGFDLWFGQVTLVVQFSSNESRRFSLSFDEIVLTWQEGWRSNADGQTFRLEVGEVGSDGEHVRSESSGYPLEGFTGSERLASNLMPPSG